MNTLENKKADNQAIIITDRKASNPLSLYIVGALLALYLFWGGTYLGMRIAIETLPPFLMAGIRFTAAGVLLYVLARLTGTPRPTAVHWKNTGMIGALLLLGGNGMVAWAEQRVPSGIAALMIAMVPVWMVLLSWFGRNGSRPNTGILAGILLGLVGTAILVLQPGSTGPNTGLSLLGILTLLFASFSWSFGSFFSRRTAQPESALLSTAMQMITGGLLLLLLSFLLGDWQGFSIGAVSLRSFAALGYLILFGSIIGYNAYIWLLKNAEPAWVSTYAFVNPIIAVFLGWAIAGEQLTLHSLIAAVVITSAVIITTVFRNRKG